MVCLSVTAGQAIPAGKHQVRVEFAYDGCKTFKVTLPGPVPVGQFWSFIVYDNQTRSMLETDQKLGGIDSNQPAMKKNADGSVTVRFAPKAPAGQEGNWCRPGRARAGTWLYSSTRRCSPGSTRAGRREISSRSTDYSANGGSWSRDRASAR